MKQVANLRSRVSSSLMFGDDVARARYERELLAARERQQVPYAVAPRCTCVTVRGVLTGGEEVRLEDLADGDVSPTQRLARLIEKGIVLVRADVEDKGPEAA